MDNEKEVVEFIDKIISTKFLEGHPSMDFHIHKCTETCYKREGGAKKKCRFHFPKFISNKTKILYPIKDVTKEMALNLGRIREKMKKYQEKRELQSFEDMLEELNLTEEKYFEAIRCASTKLDILYKRESNAVDINSYNETLLNVWESNHDMQYIPDPYALVTYLTGYQLKTDKAITKKFAQAEQGYREGKLTTNETVLKIANDFHNASIITAQQAVEELLGFSVLKFSEAEQFINTNRPENRVHMRKSIKELEEMDDDDENITVSDFIDHYAGRADLDDVCLADFAALYKREGEAENISDDEDDDDGENKPKVRNNKYILRTKERVIRYVNFRKEINEKEYWREMVMLYHPWRNEEESLLNDANVMRIFRENSDAILQKYAHYHSLNIDELENLVKEVEENLKDFADQEIEEFEKIEDERDFIPKADIFEELGIVNKQTDCNNSKEISDVYTIARPAKINENELFENLRKLNTLQQQFVQHVFHIVKTKKEHEVYPKMILLGPAGTGKSLVLKTIDQLLTNYFDNFSTEHVDEPKVLLAAYTGIAAFLIGGNTCHNAFALKIGFKGKSLNNDSTKNTISCAHREIRAIIVDELSFISRETRAKIDFNCRRIYGNDHESFGGKLVIFMGDLFQLSPVCGRPIFTKLKNIRYDKKFDDKQFLNDVLIDSVWNEFSAFELTEIVRQKNIHYQRALNNLARGEMTDEDVALINKRAVKSEKEVPEGTPHFYPTNNEVDSYNAKRIYAHQGTLYESNAIDLIKGNKLTPKIKSDLLSDYLQKDVVSMNIKSTVLIKIDIKYMITFNINVPDGLVNGANGALEQITLDPRNNKEVIILWINFNNSKVGNIQRMPYIDYMKRNHIPLHLVPIKKITLDITATRKNLLTHKVSHEAFRTQFPITPCEAMTIHKSQGQTFQRAFIDFTSPYKMTTELKYVALSRCDYDGLYILGEFKKPSVDAARSAIRVKTELKRLANEAPPKLSFHNFEQNSGKKIIYHNVRSFAAHKLDIKSINWYWKADVIIMSESNVGLVNQNEIRNDFKILYPTSDSICTKERSKGLIILCKTNVDISELSSPDIISGKTIYEEKWHIDIRTFVIDNHFVVTGYKSPKTPTSMFINKMEAVLAKAPCDLYITILGDFNFNMLKENPFKKYLEDRAFNNYLGDAITMDAKTQIDIVYSTSMQGLAGNYASYFSDHFAIFYQTEIDKNQQLAKKVDSTNDYKVESNNVEMEDEINSPIEVERNNVEIKKEINSLSDSSEDTSYTFSQDSGVKIMYHNVDSFTAVKQVIKDLDFFWKPDVIIISESVASSLQKKDINKEFKTIYRTPAKSVSKKAKGLIILCKTKDIYDFTPPDVSSGLLNSGEKWDINITTFNIHNHFIITGYMSLKAPFEIFKNKLTSLLSKVPMEMFIAIIGNFNYDMFKVNPLKQLLENRRLINQFGNRKTQFDIIYSSSPNGYGKSFHSNLSPNAALLYQTEYDKKLLNKERLVENIQECMDVEANKDLRIEQKNLLKRTNDLSKDYGDNLNIVSIKHAAKRQKLHDNEAKDQNTKHVIPMMPNSITFYHVNKPIRLELLCAYNSFLHGISASYLMRPQFAAYMESNRKEYQYFDKVIELIQNCVKGKIETFWASYLYENIVKIKDALPNSTGRFTLENKNDICSYNMVWSHDNMISALMKNLVSYSLQFKCDCGSNKTKQINILHLNSFNKNESFCDQVPLLSSKRLKEAKACCINCRKRLIACDHKFNKLLIIECSFQDSLNYIDTKIPLQDIPKSVTIKYDTFDLLFVINWQNFNHFNTFVPKNDSFIHLDDIGHKNIVIRKEDVKHWTLNPCILAFSLRDTMSD